MDLRCPMMEGKRTDPTTGIKENIKEGSKGANKGRIQRKPWFPLKEGS